MVNDDVTTLYHVPMSTHERKRFFTLGFLVIFSLFVWVPQISGANVSSDCYCLKVSFLDVGQGDSVLIQTPDGFDMLIDGGRDAGVLRELGSELGFLDKDIDVVVATHPDLDHIGGLPDVFARYNVGTFIETTNEHDTGAVTALAAASENEGSDIIYADSGQLIQLGASTTVQIFSPTGNETEWESNTASIVLRVQYGNTSFMLTGDAPQEIENYLVGKYGAQLDSDVLKLGHHGSKTSTSEEWLDAVTPTYAVVSAGIDNRYGHPHQEVMQRVFARNIKTNHTGTDDTIHFYSDGETVWRD